jgi:hypothetical protein
MGPGNTLDRIRSITGDADPSEKHAQSRPPPEQLRVDPISLDQASKKIPPSPAHLTRSIPRSPTRSQNMIAPSPGIAIRPAMSAPNEATAGKYTIEAPSKAIAHHGLKDETDVISGRRHYQ